MVGKAVIITLVVCLNVVIPERDFDFLSEVFSNCDWGTFAL